MLVIFNQSGSILNIDYQNDSFSQGDNNVHTIDVIVDEKGFKNGRYNCYIQFLREGETTPSPKLIMSNKVISYNDTKHSGFSFQMASDWYTAISGILKATIELKQYDADGLESNKAYGVINIPVNESVSSDIDTTITDEEYTSLVTLINTKVGNSGNQKIEGYLSVDDGIFTNEIEVAETTIIDSNGIATNKVEVGTTNKIDENGFYANEITIVGDDGSDKLLINQAGIATNGTINSASVGTKEIKVDKWELKDITLKYNDKIVVMADSVHNSSRDTDGNVSLGNSNYHTKIVSKSRPEWEDGNNIRREFATLDDIYNFDDISAKSIEVGDATFINNNGITAPIGYFIQNVKVDDLTSNTLSYIQTNGLRVSDKTNNVNYLYSNGSIKRIKNGESQSLILPSKGGTLATLDDIADLVNSAPETLDTLGELATAFEENKNVIEALDSAISNKADKTELPTKTSELENDSGFITLDDIPSNNTSESLLIKKNRDWVKLAPETEYPISMYSDSTGKLEINGDKIRLYNNTSLYTTLTFPRKSGTLATLDDIGSGSGGTSTSKPIFDADNIYLEINMGGDGNSYVNQFANHPDIECVLDEKYGEYGVRFRQRNGGTKTSIIVEITNYTEQDQWLNDGGYFVFDCGEVTYSFLPVWDSNAENYSYTGMIFFESGKEFDTTTVICSAGVNKPTYGYDNEYIGLENGLDFGYEAFNAAFNIIIYHDDNKKAWYIYYGVTGEM